MPKHVVTFPLLTETWQDHRLEKKFWMARQAYNCFLDEWLKRREKYFKHPLYQKAHDCDDEDRKKDLFIEAENDVGLDFNLFSGQVSASQKDELLKGTDPAYHLNADMLRLLGGRVVENVERYHKGKQEGRPKFKSSRRLDWDIRSIDACSTFQFRMDDWKFRISGVRGGVDSILIDVDNKSVSEKTLESLSGHNKNSKCSLVRKKIKGEIRYFAHLVCDGHSPIAPSINPRKGIVGVDVGVSCVAAISDNESIFVPICCPEKMSENWIKKKSLDRVLDRKRKLNNPAAFNEKGEYISGKVISRSIRHQNARDLRDEMERVGSEERKRQHYELANHLLEMGNVFIVEDNSYKGWQSGIFGRQIRDFAPSLFVDRLKEKAEAAGGSVHKVSTWDTYLSSRCHCGARANKELSDRTHKCPECGIEAQRDLYSAFLARHLDIDSNVLDNGSAQDAWPKSKALINKGLDDRGNVM